MTAGVLLGLDAGGGSGRALVLDVERGPLACARREWPHAHGAAPGTGGLGADLDLELVWRSLADASGEALARAGATPEQVIGLAACGVRFATVVLDGEGRVLLAASNRDGRAMGPAIARAQEQGAALATRTGHWPSPIQLAARLLWLSRERPELWVRAAHALSLSDWIAWRLCGELAADPSQASTTGLFDLGRGAWSDDLADAIGCRALLPALVEPGARLGGLSAEAAHAFRLRAGTPVALGGGDTQSALAGLGALEPGDAGLVAGTSAPVQVVVGRACTDSEARTWTSRHLVRGRWLVESNAGPLGEGLAWTAGSLFADSGDPVARLLAEADLAEPGARGALASFGPAVADARALALPVAGLSFSPIVAGDDPERRRLLARAAIEGMAFAMHANLEQACRVAGQTLATLRSVRLGGRLSSSPTLRSTLAGALGREIGAGAAPESSALGAALCAGVAAGAWPDLASVSPEAVRIEPVAPGERHGEVYSLVVPRWRRFAEARATADAVAAEGLLPEALRARAGSSGTAGPGHRPRMLVTADLDAASLEQLRALGPLEWSSFRQAMRLLTGPALVEALDGIEVFVTEVDVVDAEALAKLPALRVIASCRGDAVNVDVEACTAFGIPVLHAPGRNAEAVADLTIAFLLSLLRRLPEATGFLHDPGIEAGDLAKMGQAFSRLRGHELGAQTVGLVGLGAVGRAVARRLRGFGVHVLAHDPFVSAEQAARADTEWTSLEELLARSDLVSLHAPVTDETRGLLGARAFALMKSGAFLVNTARAALVDEAALADALANGRLAGAALDVFAVEPPGADHPLLSLPNVIATPHVGGNTAEVSGHQGRIVAADLARLLRGEAPRHILNREALARFDWTAPRPEPDPERVRALATRPAPAVSDLQRDGRPAAPTARLSRFARPAETETPSIAKASSAAANEIGDRMRALVADFVTRCLGDDALRAAARGRDVTLHFTVPDLDLDFWLRLRESLSGGMGAPDERPEVDLKLVADVLDGMFTGRVNPMQAAMQGRLSFTGDAAKAMTLQHLQSDLARIYRAARQSVGDPGDLAALASPVGAAAVAPAAGDDVRHELIRVVQELYAQHLITATGGNVSVRVPGRDEAWITPSQLFKGDLRPEILVRIDLDGNPLDPGAVAPSSERLMHCAVYRARPEATAVVHAHAAHATILANAGLPFLPVSTEAAFFGELPRVPFIMPGTAELAKAVEEAARSCWAVLMVNHGLLVAGRSLRRAADMAEIVERTAEVILGCFAVGRTPPVLPDAVVAELRRMGDLVA
jgi:autoinducer 2 (AI-2) kinase